VDGGEPEIALTLPEEPEYGCDPLVEGSETSWICWEGVSESDAWLIENFDPHPHRARARRSSGQQVRGRCSHVRCPRECLLSRGRRVMFVVQVGPSLEYGFHE